MQPSDRVPALIARRPSIGDAFALVLVLGVGAGILSETLHYSLFGWDTLPEIAASRIGSFRDLLDTFSERTAEGYFWDGAFYRPLLNLSLALDHAFWGLDARGYQLSSVLWFGASALAVYSLTCRVLPSATLGPLCALSAFLLLPVHAEVLPVMSRRAEILCAFFSALALSSQVHRRDASMPGGAVLPSLFTLAAVASKEIGVVLPVLATVAVWASCSPRPGRARVAHALRAAVPHLLAVGLLGAIRIAALSGLGGHPATRLSGSLERAPRTFSDLLGLLIWPQPEMQVRIVTIRGLRVGPKYRCPVFSKIEMSGFSVSISQGRVSTEEPVAFRRGAGTRGRRSRRRVAGARAKPGDAAGVTARPARTSRRSRGRVPGKSDRLPVRRPPVGDPGPGPLPLFP